MASGPSVKRRRFLIAGIVVLAAIAVVVGIIAYGPGVSNGNYVTDGEPRNGSSDSSGHAATGVGRSSRGGAQPVAVAPFRGQYCAAMGPPGWAVTAEDAQRAAFGAQFASSDGKVGAGFSIFPSGGLSPIPGVTEPEQSVSMALSSMGAVPVQMGTREKLEENVYAVYFQLPQGEGIAFYQVIFVPGGELVTLRTATTLRGLWNERGAEASAVARSLHCNVPYVAPASDPVSLNARGGSSDSESGNSEYNVWLEKETYHNPQTGENFWVSPTGDRDETGPEGPGYYIHNGNDVIKLVPGYSQ